MFQYQIIISSPSCQWADFCSIHSQSIYPRHCYENKRGLSPLCRGKTGKILLLCSWGAALAGGCCGGNEVAKWVHLPLLPPPPPHAPLPPARPGCLHWFICSATIVPSHEAIVSPRHEQKHLLNTLVLHPPYPIVHTALHSDSFPLIPLCCLLSAVYMFKPM